MMRVKNQPLADDPSLIRNVQEEVAVENRPFLEFITRNAKYIMQRLYLSEGTVKKQVFQIYKRMGVHTQQDLITLVMETDLDAAPAEEAATRS